MDIRGGNYICSTNVELQLWKQKYSLKFKKSILPIRNRVLVLCFKVGDTFALKCTPQQDDFYHLMNGKFCGEAWDAISRYVYKPMVVIG